MRHITIVGAGQSGLQLAISLLKNGYAVSLITNRTASQVLNGRIMSSQGLFNSALQYERELNLNFFEAACPKNESVSLTVSSNKKQAISWKGYPKHYFQAIDQRMKFSAWMDEFEKLGGKLSIMDVGINELDLLARKTDLVVVASGKGEISSFFPRNKSRSKYITPPRILSCLYVHGMTPISRTPGVRVNLIPGVGEYFSMPGLTSSGPCEMMLFEGIPGGPFDIWKTINTNQYIEAAKGLLNQFIPWEAERCKNIELTDSQATLHGAYVPEVRAPFAKLPSGKLALGIGDTIVLNDPIAGQGANNASRAAFLYANEIINRGEKSFDENWMLGTFEKFWNQDGIWATKWTNLLLEPPKSHMVDLLVEAQNTPLIANTVAQAFENPSIMFPWILSPKLTYDFITEAKQSHTVGNCIPLGKPYNPEVKPPL